MKTYTNNTRIGLLIVLLSCNALFACVNTRQELGINTKSYGLTAMLSGLIMAGGVPTDTNANQTNVPSVNNNNNSTTTIASPTLPDDHTSTMPSTSTTSPYNMTTEKTAFILNAISNKPADLVRNGMRFDSATNEASNNGLEEVKAPKFTNKKIADDLLKHDFSIERLTYWLDQGLDPNRVGPITGCSLIGKLIILGKIDQVRLLLARGADPNIEDLNGLTPLMTVVLSHSFDRITQDMAKDMIQPLIDYHADLCRKNSKGADFQSCLSNINWRFAYKKKWDKIITELGKEIKQWQCPTSPVNRSIFC